jgi:hypothetical protein
MNNDNPHDLMRAAVAQARSINNAADAAANNMAEVIRGRLRHVSWRNLKALKRELRAFNIHTGQWKEPA